MPSQEWTLVGTGLTLGVVHVLTGPDHLSALATLCANSDNYYTAFTLGIRWGIGHSTGLLFVGGIFLIITTATFKNNDTDNNNDNDENTKIIIPEQVSNFFECIVGIFLLILGIYGLIRAWDKRQSYYSTINNSTSIATDPDTENQPTRQGYTDTVQEDQQHTQHQHQHLFHNHNYNNMEENATVAPIQTIQPLSLATGTATTSDDLYHSYHNDCCHVEEENNVDNGNDDDITGNQTIIPTQSATTTRSCCHEQHNNSNSNSTFNIYYKLVHDKLMKVSTQSMAFVAGIVHGLAGPGGILGIIPAIQLQNFKLGTIYLFCFCVSSIITMGLFALLYGSISHTIVNNTRNTNNSTTTTTTVGIPDRAFIIEFVSALFSIIVGLLWLVLLYCGTLDDIFP